MTSLNIDESLQAQYKEVADLKSETNWCLYEIEGDGKKKNLVSVGTGTGGVEELRTKLDDSKVQFGAFQVYGVDQQQSLASKRSKVVWFTWVGKSVGVLAKAKVSVQKPDVAKLFEGAALALELSNADELEPKAIAGALLKSGGAHKPTYYDFGGGVKYELE